MALGPILSVLERSQISPPPATVGERSLPLTFFDIPWLWLPPVHHLFFYELPLTKTQFIETTVPTIKRSLSVTLQHFFPFVGNLIVYPTRKPEIRYVEGDTVAVTFAESTLDFNDLARNHPRDCDKFYPLIPRLGDATQVSDYLKIPVFSVQVTLFPNFGVSIGMTNHHSLCDASSRFRFLTAWASIARSGSDKSFLANGTLPLYDRVINNPKLDESYLRQANLGAFIEEYQPPSLSGPTDKVRATFVLTRKVINLLKKAVSTQLPTLHHVSSFTVACAYMWSCIATARNDELELFAFPVDCKARMDPPIPAAYFGNCVMGCMATAKTTDLTGKQGFVTAARLLGENLQKMLKDKDGLVKEIEPVNELISKEKPTSIIAVAGTPKVKFYDLDFGWGRPKKHETVSMDYSGSISVNACKTSYEDLEIGVSLPAAEMEALVPIFNDGLEEYV